MRPSAARRPPTGTVGRVGRRLVPLLAAALPLMVAACASGVVRSPQAAATEQDELRELKERVLELQRKAAVAEVELDRLRERLAALESGNGPALRRPPTAAPARPAPADLEPTPPTPASAPRRAPSVIEESDLVEPSEPAPIAVAPAPAPTASGSAPAAAAPASPPLAVSATAQALYDRGYTLFHQGKYVDAESSFRQFIQSYPDTDLSDNAQYWIGEARYARGDLRGALAAFRETVERFPAGNKVADALLKAGQCLEGLGDADGARASYREVIERFPGSAAAAVGEERLERMP